MAPERLRILRQAIENCFNRGSSAAWKNSDYIDLSHEIHIKTGETISPGTLKRIFGKIRTPDDYSPQPGVQKILMKYCGLNSFPGETKTIDKFLNAEQNIKKIKPFIYLIATILFLYMSIWFLRHIGYILPDDYSVYVKDSIGNAYHTVVFDYHFPEKYQDEIILEFGDGTSEVLDLKDSILTHYYRKPDLYKGYFRYKNHKLDSFHVYLMTDGWELYSTKDYPKGVLKRFYPIVLPDSGIYSSTLEAVQKSGIDTMDLFYTHYCYYDSLNDSSYPIHLEADIRTDIEIAQARCNHVIINLVGSNERIRLYFLKPGCTRWSMIRIGEKDYDGLYHDLSSFGVDFSEWKAVSLHITRAENKFLLQVSVDSESVFRDDFSTQLGDILGVEFTFSGCGKFKNPELNDRPIR